MADSFKDYVHSSQLESLINDPDRTNYCSYGTIYWLEMSGIEHTHPGMFISLFCICGI